MYCCAICLCGRFNCCNHCLCVECAVSWYRSGLLLDCCWIAAVLAHLSLLVVQISTDPICLCGKVNCCNHCSCVECAVSWYRSDCCCFDRSVCVGIKLNCCNQSRVARPLFLAQGVIACSISARTQQGSGMVRQADLFLTPTRFCR